MSERPFITPSAEKLGRVAYFAWRSSRDLGTEWEHLAEEVRGHWRFVGLAVAREVQKGLLTERERAEVEAALQEGP